MQQHRIVRPSCIWGGLYFCEPVGEVASSEGSLGFIDNVAQ